MKTVQFLILAAWLVSACGSDNQYSIGSAGRMNTEQKNIPLDWQSVGLLGLPPITFSLGLLGTVASPTLNGTTLAADDVLVVGTTAFISYNLGGNTLAGAIDQITNVLNLPVLGATVTTPGLKINGVFKNGTDLFAIGASSGSDGPAVLKKYYVPSTLIPTTLTPTASVTLGSYAGVGVLQRGTTTFAVSGDDATNGGVTVLDSTLTQTAFLPIKDARGITYSSLGTGDMYIIAAQPGRIVQMTTTGTLVRTIALGGGVTTESKSTITAGKTMVMATIGEGGSKIVCMSDQKVLASIPAPTVSGLAASATVTNAIAAGPGLLFVANGEAGVYVYSLKDSNPSASVCNTLTVSLLGSINLGAGLSANNVKYSGGILYIANGLGGFRLVSVTSLPTASDDTDFL